MRPGIPGLAPAVADGAEASTLGVFGALDTGSLFHLLSVLDGSSLVRLGACRCVTSVCASGCYQPPAVWKGRVESGTGAAEQP